MDEYRADDDQEFEEEGLENYEAVEAGEGEETTEAQRAEAADVAKLLRAHPEIWIPYEDQVLQQLNIAPVEGATESKTPEVTVGNRDLKTIDSRHTTYPFLTNYERTKVISFRASQINHGAKPYIVVPTGVTDSFHIAKMELEAKRLPFIIKRPLPDGSFEVWRLADLQIF